MSAKIKQETTKQAERAMCRAALKVLKEAVQHHESIPIWDGKKAIMKVPEDEYAQCLKRYEQLMKPQFKRA